MSNQNTAQALNLFGQICKKLDSVQFKINAFIINNVRDAHKAADVEAKKKLAAELNEASSKACQAYDSKNIEMLKDLLSLIMAKSN